MVDFSYWKLILHNVESCFLIYIHLILYILASIGEVGAYLV